MSQRPPWEPIGDQKQPSAADQPGPGQTMIGQPLFGPEGPPPGAAPGPGATVFGPPIGAPGYGPPPGPPAGYGAPPAGGPAPYQQAPYGQAPYGQAPYGQAPYGQAPYGQQQQWGRPFGAPAPYGSPGYGYGAQPQYGYRPAKPSNAGAIIAVVVGLFIVGTIGVAAVGAYTARKEVEDRADIDRDLERMRRDREAQAERDRALPPKLDLPKIPAPGAGPGSGADADGSSSLASTDGLTELKIPSTWTSKTGLNDEAQIQAGNRLGDEFTIVLTESKTDFANTNLQKYADICLNGMRTRMPGITLSKPKSIDIGGRPALQYEIMGAQSNVNIGYLMTFLDGKTHYHQIMGWTMKSRFEMKKADLAKVTASLREK